MTWLILENELSFIFATLGNEHWVEYKLLFNNFRLTFFKLELIARFVGWNCVDFHKFSYENCSYFGPRNLFRSPCI